jgi:hypothetical protein
VTTQVIVVTNRIMEVFEGLGIMSKQGVVSSLKARVGRFCAQ